MLCLAKPFNVFYVFAGRGTFVGRCDKRSDNAGTACGLHADNAVVGKPLCRRRRRSIHCIRALLEHMLKVRVVN